MSKVIDYNDIWYQEIAARSYYDEEDLERTIIQNLQIIFPEFKALFFKQKLIDPIRSTASLTKRNTPDLAMVKNDYSEWYIIEVELGKHDKDHVLDQIATFYNCKYTDAQAVYMQNQRPTDFDLTLLKKMVATPPKLMVIVNEENTDWKKDLKTYRCELCIFQVYQDFNGNPLYRLGGEHPFIRIDFCHCKYDKGLPYTVEVLDKDFLESYGIKDGETFNIEFKDRTFKWLREDSSGRVFLYSTNPRPPLDPMSDRYRLNYNQGSLNIPPNRGLLNRIISIFSPNRTISQSFKTFSFTKD